MKRGKNEAMKQAARIEAIKNQISREEIIEIAKRAVPQESNTKRKRVLSQRDNARAIDPTPEVAPLPPPPEKSKAQEAWEKLREDMVEQHIKVTTLYHVQGPKGVLYVYLDSNANRWQVTPTIGKLPIAGSVHMERALTWAQNQLV